MCAGKTVVSHAAIFVLIIMQHSSSSFLRRSINWLTRQKQLQRRPGTKQLKNNSLSSSSVASNCWLCFAAVILEMADSTVSSRISSNIFFLAASLRGLINSSISKICKSGKPQVKTCHFITVLWINLNKKTQFIPKSASFVKVNSCLDYAVNSNASFC